MKVRSVKLSLRILLPVFVLMAIGLTSRRAFAQVDPFEFEIYPYQTVGRGMVELETLNSVVANGHSTGDAGTSSGDFASQSMWRNAY